MKLILIMPEPTIKIKLTVKEAFTLKAILNADDPATMEAVNAELFGSVAGIRAADQKMKGSEETRVGNFAQMMYDYLGKALKEIYAESEIVDEQYDIYFLDKILNDS